MSYISEYSSITSTNMIYRDQKQEEALRDSYEVLKSVTSVRQGRLAYKTQNYTRLVNGTSCEPQAYRVDLCLIDSGLQLLDFDLKDHSDNNYKNIDRILRPHIEEWGIVHMEESIRGGAHITVRKIEGLTPSEIIRLYELRTGLPLDYSCTNLSKVCFLVPNSMVHYVNPDLYYHMDPIPPLPLHPSDQQLLQSDRESRELLHQQQIQQRLLTAPRYIPEGTEEQQTIRIIEAIDQAQIPVDDYNQWVDLGLFIAFILGPSGRHYFHLLSHHSCKYHPDDCDRKYDNLLRTSRGEVGIGTLIWFARGEGVIV